MNSEIVAKIESELKHLESETDQLYQECLKAYGGSNGVLGNARIRYESMFQIMLATISSEKLSGEAQRLMMSVGIGSVLECVLQLFLMTFTSDYENSDWQKWKDFNETDSINLINGALKQAVKSDMMSPGQRKSTLKEIKAFFKRKRDEPAIESVMLSDLLAFYCSKGVVGESDCVRFRSFGEKIRNGRNCIHAFSSSAENDFTDMSELLEEFEYILTDLLKRAQYSNGSASPCIDAILSLKEDHPESVHYIVVVHPDESPRDEDCS